MPDTASQAGFNVPDEFKPPSQDEILSDAQRVQDSVGGRLLRGMY